jgi:hypothetical protein
MKRMLFVLVLAVAGVAVFGFYREWFHFGSSTSDGKSNVTLSVDKDKFQEDRKAAVEGVQNLGKAADKAGDKADSKGKDKVAGKSHDGKVVRITSSKLVMTNMNDAEEHTHALTADAAITCDGKVCKAGDLKAGMRIRVTTESAAPHAATRIEALDDNPDFEKGA